jgi:hypothetical protein
MLGGFLLAAECGQIEREAAMPRVSAWNGDLPMRVMVTARVSLMLAAMFALAAAGVARADTASPEAQPPSTAPPDQHATAPADAGKKPDEQTPGDMPAVVVDDNKVESLLGKDVTSAKGEKLGQITDILVSHSGEVRAAVIDFGGFLGVGSRKIAVAWRTLQFSPKGITLSMTRDELRVTPEYHQGEPVVIVGASAPPAQPAPSAQPGPPQPSGPSTTSAPVK